MAAKQNFCPAGEELESRNLLNIGTPALGAFVGIEGIRDAEHRALVQQRVHARRIPKQSDEVTEIVHTRPTFTWQVPASLASAFTTPGHPHSITVQVHTVTGRNAFAPVRQPAHPVQNLTVSVTAAANLPAGALVAFSSR
jgi:hypothetical protein